MDLAGMRLRVRMLLNEATEKFYLTSNIDNEINDACVTVARDTEELLTYCDHTTADDQQTYTLGDDFLKLKFVQIKKATGDWDELDVKTQREWQRYTDGASETQGTPEVCKLELGSTLKTDPHPGDIWLYPIPDTSGPEIGGHYKLRIHYYQTPTALVADSDTTELPLHAHKAVCFLAASNMAMQASEFTLGRELERKYIQEKSELLDSYNELHRVKAGYVTDVMGYSRTEF